MKAKNVIIPLLLVVFFSFIYSCSESEDIAQKPAELSNHSTKLWSPNDENLDKNWDWTNPKDQNGNPRIYELYVDNSYVGHVIYERQLPYFTYDGGPVSNDLSQSLDIFPEYGWELFGRDFGSIQDFNRYVKMPWFALYNRARGILRFFYFNTLPGSYTYGIATLTSCDGNGGKIGAFNAFRQKDASLDDYTKNGKWNGIECIHTIESLKWCYADFDLSYEPNIIADTNFVFNVYGINEDMVDLDGNINLEQYVETERVGTDFFHNLFSSIKAATGYYKTTKDALDKINEVREDNSSSKKVDLSKIIVKSPITVVAGVVAVIGFVYSFAKGMYADQVVSMGYYGYMNLNGTIIGNQDIDAFKMHVPGSNRISTDYSYEPIYNKPMGIVSFKTRPKVGFKINYYPMGVFSFCLYTERHFIECGLIEPIQLEINYDRIQEEITHYNIRKGQNETYSFRVKSIEAAAVYADGKTPPYQQGSIILIDEKVNQFKQIDAFYQQHNFYLDPTYVVFYSSVSNSLFYAAGDELVGELNCPLTNYNPTIDAEIDSLSTKIYIAVRVLIEPVHTPVRYNADGTYTTVPAEPIEIIRTIRPEYIRDPLPDNTTLFSTPCNIPASLNGGVKVTCCE